MTVFISGVVFNKLKFQIKVGQFQINPKLGQFQINPKLGQFQINPKLGQFQTDTNLYCRDNKIVSEIVEQFISNSFRFPKTTTYDMMKFVQQISALQLIVFFIILLVGQKPRKGGSYSTKIKLLL